MKTVYAINPDFIDSDSLDADALAAVEEFSEGNISFSELKEYVGTDVLKAIQEQRAYAFDPEQYFDDPESF